MHDHSWIPENAETARQSERTASERSPAGLFSIWYRLTSSPEPARTASFQERERFRRGRTGSQISIALFLLIFISFPAAFAGSNSLLIGILTGNLFALCLALLLNRLGKVNLAGIIIVIGVIFSPTTNIVTTPGGLNTSVLPIFGFLVLSLVVTISFLPPGWVFVVAASNSLFTFVVLKLLPSSGELHNVLQVAFPGIVTPIILSQWIVAIVSYLWVRGAQQAILRADRAEEIANLERRELERQRSEIEQKQQLDMGIQQLIQTHMKVANGDFAARAPLMKENILWQVAYSLNNLLARLQSYQLFNVQQKKNQEALNYLIQAVQQAKREGGPLRVQRTGTPVDALIIELSSLRFGDPPATHPSSPSPSPFGDRRM